MSERWISNKKYYCDFCKIFLADNKQTRNLHESGLKHKGNVERHLTEMRKRDAEKEKQAEYTARILGHVERKATAAYHSQDLASSRSETHRAVAGLANPSGRVYGVKADAKPVGVSERPKGPAGAASAAPPVTAAKIDEASGLGMWSVVESAPVEALVKEDKEDSKGNSDVNAVKEAPSKHANLDHEAVYEEDVDGEGVSGFQISEKRVAVSEDVDETVTFKKKKKRINK
ncbi:hypothetical protein HDU98_009298 [Podochytrium sp. JEL0797]|nr:hypothetical protein HDU98_009298 [Podochytrium sp. JEL0797]